MFQQLGPRSVLRELAVLGVLLCPSRESEVCSLVTNPEVGSKKGRQVPSDRGLVNRFFRSALFPLIIIAALVWLALQTLGSHGQKTTQATTSQVYHLVQTDPGAITQPVTIDPHKQSITVV